MVDEDNRTSILGLIVCDGEKKSFITLTPEQPGPPAPVGEGLQAGRMGKAGPVFRIPGNG